MRRLLAPAIVAATLPSLAVAQDRPSLLDYFSIDTIFQRFVQTGILALRTQMDLKYSDISIDISTGGITMTDLTVWPLPEWDVDGTCEMNVDRINIRSGALDQPDRFRFKAQLTGTNFPVSCLPPDVTREFGFLELETIDMPRMTIDVDYGVPKSDAVVRIFADITDMAAADMTAEIAYFWFDGREDIEEPLPVIFLQNATLTLENKGGWDKVKTMVPPPFMGDGSGAALQGLISQGLASESENGQVTDSQSAFAASVGSTWPAFLAAPERLVLETDLDGDVFVDVEQLEDLEYLFDTLRPVVSLAPSSISKILSLDILKTALSADASGLSADDKRAAGIALATGVGAPRNLVAGLKLLEPLVDQGDGVAASVLSDILETRDPETSYRLALIAGQTGETGATARLDRLERALNFDRILQLQDESTGNTGATDEMMNSIADLRTAAANHLSGRGASRSYETAAMLAMIASAAGDPEAGDILENIDERVRLAGPSAIAAWTTIEAKASGAATDAWINNDLPARFNK